LITTLEVAELNSFSLIRRVQTNGLSIPVIIIAKGNENVLSIVNAMKAGASDFIYKPLFVHEFVDKIKRVMKR
jgi:FixJ family two-component response regulator